MRNSSVIGRVAAVAAVVIALGAVAVILLSSGSTYKVRAEQLTSDFISNGAAGIAAKTTSVAGGGTGHYLRQFSPIGAETLGIFPNRDADNRGNTYPAPLWLANPENLKKGNFPSWDCKNTSTGGPVSAVPGPVGPVAGLGSQEACWIAPTLPGAKPGQIPHILKKTYPAK